MTSPQPDTILLIRSLQNRTVLAQAPWSTLSYEARVNNAGGLTATVPTFDGGMTGLLLPGRVLVGVLRGSTPVWSGILWKRTLHGEGYMEIDCDELLSYWDRRRIRRTFTFTQIDQGAILQTLVDLPQRDLYGGLGVKMSGNLVTGVLRDRTYIGAERKSYGDMIRNLLGVLGGCDMKSSPVLENGIWRDYFELGHPRLGRDITQSRLVFMVGVNCTVESWEEDAASTATVTESIGSNPADSTMPLISGYEAPFLYAGGWPRLEDTTSYTDVNDLTTLGQKAQADQAARSGAVLSIKIKVPDSTLDPVLGSYAVGDDCRLIVPPGPTFPSGYDIQQRIAAISINAGARDEATVTMVPALLDSSVFTVAAA